MTVPDPFDIELPRPSSFRILLGYGTAEALSILAVASLGLSPWSFLFKIESLSKLLAPALSRALFPSLSNVDFGYSSLLMSYCYSSSFIVFS